MEKIAFLEDLQQRLASLIEGTPAADLPRNLKALLTQQFAQLELVTREEFDAQLRVLARSREKLQDLERRLAELEARRNRDCLGKPGRGGVSRRRCGARQRSSAAQRLDASERGSLQAGSDALLLLLDQ